jgi:hypothetical protein
MPAVPVLNWELKAGEFEYYRIELLVNILLLRPRITIWLTKESAGTSLVCVIFASIGLSVSEPMRTILTRGIFERSVINRTSLSAPQSRNSFPALI